jgi:hypothetical protein
VRGAVLAALMLTACAAQDIPAPHTELSPQFNPEGMAAMGDSCGASAHADLIGKPYDETQRDSLPANTRVIRHDMANTLGLTPSRTNVTLDERGQVAAIGCY